MYHPTTRVLTVLELLQSHHRLSGPELARRLEVNVRTARRYITMLQDMGIPIEAERGRHGAYRLRAGFKLPPLMFNEDEALAVILGLQAARQLGLAATAPAVEGALAKIERVLPTELRNRVQALHQSLSFDLERAEAPLVGATLRAFGAAAGQGQQLYIRYCAAKGDETERAVDPYGLVFHAGRWYAVCYCHLRVGLRVFRLDRVQHVTALAEPFTRPPGFDALAYVVNSIARMPGSWNVEVLLHAPLGAAREYVSPTLGTLEAVTEGTLLCTNVEELEWLARFLCGLPWSFAIHQPAELRDVLRRHAQCLLDATKDDAP